MDQKFVRIILMVGLLALLPLAASAVTVAIGPDRVAPGDQVTATFDGLPDHSRVSIEIAATFSAVPGSTFSFENSNFNIPFALSNGSISATLQNTVKNNIAVRQGDAEVRFSGDSVNGMYSKSFPFDIGPGTFDFIRLSGTAAGDTILSNLRISGTKTGPSSGEIRFSVAGVESGQVAMTIRVNDTVVIAKTVVIASDEPGPGTTVPTTGASPVTTQVETTGGSSSENGGSSSPVTTVTTAASSTEIAGSSTPGTAVTTQVTVTTVRAQNGTPSGTSPVTTAGTLPSSSTTKADPGLLFIPAGLAGAYLLFRRR